MGRKGIRKYFSKPLKGCKTYGMKKKWRREKEKATINSDAAHHHSGLSLSSPAVTTSLDTDTNFQGFDVAPLNVADVSEKKTLRVLSLFDGISVGYYTLFRKLHLEIDIYYSSEICPDALRVQKQNFHGRIHQLGSVRNLTNDKVYDLGPIDLLLGGSPCSDLSLVNPKRKGIWDPRGTGYLFFDFVRILNHLRGIAEHDDLRFFWLFENTAKMEKKTCDTMSGALGCDPVLYNSSAFVPMERKRNFWGNIPKLGETPSNNHVPLLQDFLRPLRTAVTTALPTLTSTSHSQTGRNKLPPVIEDGLPSYLWPNEMEVIFGLPEHFTDYQLSATQRRQLLGKAWSVHVIEHILKPLTIYYRQFLRHEG